MSPGLQPVWVGLLTVLCGAGLVEAQPVAIPSAQPASAAILSASDLQADAALLRRAYTTLHPGLYRYNTPAQMDAASDAKADCARKSWLSSCMPCVLRTDPSFEATRYCRDRRTGPKDSVHCLSPASRCLPTRAIQLERLPDRTNTWILS